ncbi:TonB-dependent receptor [Subsaxibacter sp. CAU 1640]|uniref:TonB-dependent receptor n=1 Tax=Subsaxibacter sp. CAU 1640 TaxID=2933271 RepID=UPI0020048DD8|nr:TonB-dependent receptor [Subsaxibacter sp. CAU 1640]MCK7589958.1 TonB-dependent receptor [Subsaxibacter sp. CAU 1640]
MKKAVLIILTFFVVSFLYSQENPTVTVSFDNVFLKDVLIKLEEQTGYNFYFQEEWLLDEKKVTGTYNNSSLKEVLQAILENSLLNFLIYEKSVILTRNSLIYSELPSGYFEKTKISNPNLISNGDEDLEPDYDTPVLQKDYQSENNNSKREYITLGKADSRDTKTTFTISGTIIDYSTKKPVSDIVVAVKGRNTNSVTNESGAYSLKLPRGTYEIYTKSLGYQDSEQKIVVYGNGMLNLEVEESLTQLEEIIIESNKDDNIKQTIVGVTTIDVEQIKTIPLVLGERDVLKVATTMPGVKTAGEGALGYNVRGGKTDQNLILFDKAVMYNPSHFFGIFSAINPFTTGNVKIFKGTIPAEYGGRLSSVIDIETKESNVEKFSGEASVGPVTGNLTLETPIIKNKSSLMTAVRATYSGWILNMIEEESVKNSEASFYDAVVKYNHKINDNNSLKGTLYFSNDKFSITSDSIFKYHNRLASMQWDHTFNDKHRGNVQLVNSQYKFNISYENEFNRDFNYDYSIDETELKFNLKYLHNKAHKFDYGFSSKIYFVEPGEIKPLGDNSSIEFKKIEREKALESAFFVSDLMEVNDKLSFDIGLRYSFYSALGKGTQNRYAPGQPISDESVVETITYQNNEVIKSYSGFEPRVSFRYFLSPSLSVKGGYNKTIQYIHLLSSNTTMSPVDTWKLSDLNIEPQKAHQFSLGVFKNFGNDVYEASVDGYYKKMDDILDFKIGAELNLNENIETELLQGEGRAYGIEFLLKKKNGRLNGWIGYSYSKSEIKLDSEFLTERVNNGEFFASNYDRPHDFNIVSNFKLTKRYSFSMNFNYQTGRPLTYPIGKFIYNGTEQVVYSDRNAERIPDYYRLDLGVNIEGNHKIKKFAHSFWNISVYNVLGRSNPYSVYFVSEQGGVKAYKTSIFAVPIPTITYNFKF